MLDLSIYFDRSFRSVILRVILRVIFRHKASICLSQLRFLSITIPRSLCCSTVWIISLSIYISIWSSRLRFCRDARVMYAVFCICTCILLDLHQQKKPFAPHCSLNPTTFSSLLAACIVESSAYRSTSSVPFVNKGMSFIKRRNSTGPKTEPWGTPDLTVWNSDFMFFSTIHCLRFARYDLIQLRDEFSNL